MHAWMTRLTDTKRQAGRLRPPPSSHRLAADGSPPKEHEVSKHPVCVRYSVLHRVPPKKQQPCTWYGLFGSKEAGRREAVFCESGLFLRDQN